MGVLVDKVNGFAYQHCAGTDTGAGGGCAVVAAPEDEEEVAFHVDDGTDARDFDTLMITAFGGRPLCAEPPPGGGEGCDLGGW
jgi:hypothetical protein